MAARRCPLVLAIIGFCIVIGLFANTLNEGRGGQVRLPNAVERNMLFTDIMASRSSDGRFDEWASIRAGQVWRLVTPIFLHYGVMHIVFNLLWFFDLGGQVETRRGTWYLFLLILALAILSNIGQAIEVGLMGGEGIRFGGMSGVVYGLIGYVFVKTRFDNTAGYNLSPSTMFLAMLWFVLCIARDYPPFDSMLASWIPKIANSAHAVGLFAGMAIAYAPLLVRRSA